MCGNFRSGHGRSRSLRRAGQARAGNVMGISGQVTGGRESAVSRGGAGIWGGQITAVRELLFGPCPGTSEWNWI
jgi:hypothetical protein